MKSYRKYIKIIKKRDNLTNLKYYFNKYIFISIQNYQERKVYRIFLRNLHYERNYK